MKRKKGTGFTTRESESIPVTPENFQRILQAFSRLKTDYHRMIDHIEACRAELSELGFGGNVWTQREAIRAKFGDESFEDLVAEILDHADRVLTEKKRIESGSGDIEHLISEAVWWGVYRERIFWKGAPDPKTGAPIEALALERQRKREPFQRRNEGRDAKNRERIVEKDQWYDLAQEIADNSRLIGGDLNQFIRNELLRRHNLVKSRRSVSRFLTGK